MTRLAIVVVSWNTRDLLDRALATARASLDNAEIDYQVVVVDNASRDGTPAMLRANHPDVRLLEPGQNLGFAGGNNLALRVLIQGDRRPETGDGRPETGDGRPETRRRIVPPSAFSLQPSAFSVERSAFSLQPSTFSPPEYLLLLNPDTEVVGDAIARLVRYLDEHPDVDVVGPQLRYPDGSVQPSRRRFPSRGVFFFESTPLETRWPANPWARRYRVADRPDSAPQEVDWLVGAALLVRRTAIERAGLLDAGFAMYSEELEWQQRIRAVGGRGFGTRRRERRDRETGDGRQGDKETRRQGDTRHETGRKVFQPSAFSLQPSAFSLQPSAFGFKRSRSSFTPHSGRIVYLPDAVIMHHEGKSSEQAPARRYVQFHQSRLRHARMLYGRRFAAVVQLFLLAAYGFELAIEAGKWLAGHKRPLRAERVGVYWQVLRQLARRVGDQESY